MNGGTIVAIAPPESSFPSQESTEHGLPAGCGGGGGTAELLVVIGG